MNRRTYLCVIAGTLLAAPLAAGAQQTGTVWRVGVLMALGANDSIWPEALREGLHSLGYVEGQNLAIEWRYAQGKPERLPGLAAALVRLKIDVIVADRTPAIRTAMQATSTIPIVMALSADAVDTGFVANLGHPGGNVTGLSVMQTDLSAKRVQIFKEAVPLMSRLAVLWNPALPWHATMLRDIDAVTQTMGLHAVPIGMRTPSDLDTVFTIMRKERVDTLLVNETFAVNWRRRLLEAATSSRLPTMFVNSDYVKEGGLMAYSPNFPAMFRRAAFYVDRILKGAKPGDLPVEQPTTFELVINLKTANALGLTIPPSLLARADQVIE